MRHTHTIPAVLASALLALSACTDGVAPPRPVATLTIVAGDRQSAEVDTELPEPLVVQVTDALGAPLAGVVVRFEGTGRAESGARSDANGIATARWTLGTRAGEQVMHATAEQPKSVQALTFTATALPGPPARIHATSGDSALVSPGTQLDTVRVIVFDRFANPTPFVPIAWSVTAGQGTVRPLSTITDGGGVARAIWTTGPDEGLQTLSVSSGGVTRELLVSTMPALVATEVVAGFDHSCALVEGGIAYCWGANVFGQLGIGGRDYGAHPIPLRVVGGLSFRSLAAGAIHTCGLTAVGETYCWGSNFGSQAGGATEEPFVVPRRVAGAPAFIKLVAGAFHTCGLTSSGSAYCWGDNSVGQLGNGAQRSQPEKWGFARHPDPVPVAGSIAFSTIAAALYGTCGISQTGDTYCWGDNSMKGLGSDVSSSCRLLYEDNYPPVREESDVPCSTSPVRVVLVAPPSSLTASGLAACAVLATAELQCWGYGQPPGVVPNAGVTEAWALWSDVCGRAPDGRVSCWSLGRTRQSTRPFGDGLTLVNLSSSGRHSCGLTPGLGKVYCWGSNFEGALGDGTTRHREHPAPVVSPLALGKP